MMGVGISTGRRGSELVSPDTRRYHPTFRDFQAAIPEVLNALPTKYSQQPVSGMTRILQHFDDVSLMAAQGK